MSASKADLGRQNSIAGGAVDVSSTAVTKNAEKEEKLPKPPRCGVLVALVAVVAAATIAPQAGASRGLLNCILKHFLLKPLLEPSGL